MEGIGIFLIILVVIVVGGWILQTVGSGIEAGIDALIKAPFKAFGKAREKRKVDAYVNGLYFETRASSDQLHRALSAHLHTGDFHPMNRVIVQTDHPGHYVLGFTWDQDVTFTMDDGSTAHGSGLPVVVVEITYGPSGSSITGRMRMTRFSHDQDWTQKALMESVFPWCFAPIAALDPSARLQTTPPNPHSVNSANTLLGNRVTDTERG